MGIRECRSALADACSLTGVLIRQVGELCRKSMKHLCRTVCRKSCAHTEHCACCILLGGACLLRAARRHRPSACCSAAAAARCSAAPAFCVLLADACCIVLDGDCLLRAARRNRPSACCSAARAPYCSAAPAGLIASALTSAVTAAASVPVSVRSCRTSNPRRTFHTATFCTAAVTASSPLEKSCTLRNSLGAQPANTHRRAPLIRDDLARTDHAEALGEGVPQVRLHRTELRRTEAEAAASVFIAEVFPACRSRSRVLGGKHARPPSARERRSRRHGAAARAGRARVSGCTAAHADPQPRPCAAPERRDRGARASTAA